MLDIREAVCRKARRLPDASRSSPIPESGPVAGLRSRGLHLIGERRTTNAPPSASRRTSMAARHAHPTVTPARTAISCGQSQPQRIGYCMISNPPTFVSRDVSGGDAWGSLARDGARWRGLWRFALALFLSNWPGSVRASDAASTPDDQAAGSDARKSAAARADQRRRDGILHSPHRYRDSVAAAGHQHRRRSRRAAGSRSRTSFAAVPPTTAVR